MSFNYSQFKAQYYAKKIEESISSLRAGGEGNIIVCEGEKSWHIYDLECIGRIEYILRKTYEGDSTGYLTIVFVQGDKSQVLYDKKRDKISMYSASTGMFNVDDYEFNLLCNKLLHFINAICKETNDYIDNKSKSGNLSFCFKVRNSHNEIIDTCYRQFFVGIINQLKDCVIESKTDKLIDFYIIEGDVHTLLCVDKF